MEQEKHTQIHLKNFKNSSPGLAAPRQAAPPAGRMPPQAVRRYPATRACVSERMERISREDKKVK
jgi:hypothetical protein